MNFLKLLIFFLLPILLSRTAVSQVGKDAGYWEFLGHPPHAGAIVEVHTPAGGGTGVVVSLGEVSGEGNVGYVLTAWHVVDGYENSKELRLKYQNGGAKDSRVMYSDEEADIALIYTWIPRGVVPIQLAENGESEFFTVSGLGGYSNLNNIRYFGGFRKLKFPSTEVNTYYDVPVISGDSGSPVMNQLGKLTGSVSGGWRWYNSNQIKNTKGVMTATTYPLKTASLKRIKKLMSRIK